MRNWKAIASGALLALPLVLGLPQTAGAEEGWSYDLSHELMSPYCPGRTLADCPSDQATDVVEWMVEQERAGRGEEEVRGELYARFGEILRAAPKPEGVGLLSYGLPLLALLAGGAVVATFLRRQSSGPAPAAPAEVDPEALRAIDAELADDPTDRRA